MPYQKGVLTMNKSKNRDDLAKQERLTTDDVISTLVIIASFAKSLARQLIVEQENYKKEELRNVFRF